MSSIYAQVTRYEEREHFAPSLLETVAGALFANAMYEKVRGS